MSYILLFDRIFIIRNTVYGVIENYRCPSIEKFNQLNYNIMKKRVIILISALAFLFVLPSCEKIFCTSEEEVGGDDCTKTFANHKTKLSVSYGSYSGTTNLPFADLETGFSYSATQTTASDISLSGNDNGMTITGVNGTKLAATSLNSNEWSNVCDSYLLPSKWGSEPTGNSVSLDGSQSGTNGLVVFFKTDSGKYGLFLIVKITDYTIKDMWDISEIDVKIQK